ncbi:MAG: hypothetical protein MJ237_04350 [bacterium]|nr:hypothetical protein [bacterium]
MIDVNEVAYNSVGFRSKKTVEKTQDSPNETRLLPDTASTHAKQQFQKTASAFIDYPIKGLKGDVNTNFYEFLSMGIIPYLTGSAMLMFVFNLANKYLKLFPKEKAQAYGGKMALGVVLYGLFKDLSKHLVTKPVKAATGVNIDKPYENIVYQLPKGAGENANLEVLHQQRTVYDSNEFYRKDLLDKEYFDKVAKKLGLGENLNDSVSETSPIIQNIVSTTNTAKSISTYLFAMLGIALATQDSWLEFFSSITGRNKYVSSNNGFISNMGGKLKNMWHNSVNITKSFFHSFGKACCELWKGKPQYTGFMRHAGKYFILGTGLVTTMLTSNAIIKAKRMAKNTNKETIDKSKESTVI